MSLTICVYCGSNEGSDPAYGSAAAGLARALVSRGVGIVYGGGMRGLMGGVAKVAIEHQVPLTGIIPERFRSSRSTPPEGATYLSVGSMQERKEKMRNLADAFVALPGGIGTIDEIAETLMMRSLGFHEKPLGLLNVGGFFDSFTELMRRATGAGFMKQSLLDSLIVSDDAEALVDALIAGIKSPGNPV